MILIDTDIAIDHFHGHHAALEYFAQALAGNERLAISVITIAELTSGMRVGEEGRTERLFELFQVVEIDEAIARRAGDYLRQFRRSHRLELGDALIGATAAQTGAVLITRNVKHYPMTDLTVSVPYQRGAA